MAAETGASYEIDWKAQPRRPFKRGFLPYSWGCEEIPAAAVTKRRQVLGLEIVEDPAGDEATPVPAESFEELGVFPAWLLDVLRDLDKFEPTPLQAQALPILLAGQNTVAVSRPNSGQVMSYLLPALVHIEDQPPLADDDAGPICIVLLPTQELATKCAEEATKLLRYSRRSKRHTDGVRCVNVSGGGARSEKLKELSSKGPHIVVGTAKRVHDMASKEQISLLRTTFLVLDGADRVVELGFHKEVQELASWIRPERQTLMVAATWPKAMGDLAEELCFAGGPAVHFSSTLAKAPDEVLAKQVAARKAKAAAEEKNQQKKQTADDEETQDANKRSLLDGAGVEPDLKAAKLAVVENEPAQAEEVEETDPALAMFDW